MIKNILISLATSIALGLLTWIAISVKDVPTLKEDNKIQHERYDELIQQEMDKRHEMEIEIAILKSKIK